MRIWQVLRRSPSYACVLGAGLVSQVGDWILGIGLTYYVYAVTGSTLVSSVVLLSALLPQLVLGTVAGVFVDRWERRGTMIATNLLMAAVLVPLLFVSDDAIWPVYPVLVAVNCIEQFFIPAEQAIIPTLVEEDDLVTANALNGQVAQVSRLVGAAMGGLAAGLGGLTAVVLVDLATYLLAAALLLGVRRRRVSGSRRSPSALGTGLLSEWREGVAVARANPTLRILLGVAAVTSVGEGLMGVLFVPFVRDDLSGSAAAYGTIVSVQAVGGILSGFVVATVGPRFSSRALFGWGMVAFGSIDLALFLYPLGYRELWPAYALIAVVGLPGALVIVGHTTLMQTSTTDAVRGRLFGALGAVRGAGMLLGVLLAGYLGEVVGIIPVLAWQGAGYLVCGVVVVAAMRRSPATLAHPDNVAV